MVSPFHTALLELLVPIKYENLDNIPLLKLNLHIYPQDPGRVWPGKKMAGRLGGERTTAQNLTVVRVDTTLDLIFVQGCVPGVDDAFVMIRDAKKKMESVARVAHTKGQFDKVLPNHVDDLPFPAGTKELAAQLPPIIVAPSARVTSPFTPRE